MRMKCGTCLSCVTFGSICVTNALGVPMDIIRHSAPTKLDQSPLGTNCKVMTGNGQDYELYIQYSADSEHPSWEYLGVIKPMSEKQIKKTKKQE